jgi:hypothetical protein
VTYEMSSIPSRLTERGFNSPPERLPSRRPSSAGP